MGQENKKFPQSCEQRHATFLCHKRRELPKWKIMPTAKVKTRADRYRAAVLWTQGWEEAQIIADC